MGYKIHMGIPEMEEFWNSLSNKIKNKSATKTEEKQYKQIGKALYLLSINPRYPSLKTHEIEPLTNRIDMKVWQSYLENNTPSAGRIYWAYGPNKEDITILAIEPHPNDSKANAYKKIVLSKLGNKIY